MMKTTLFLAALLSASIAAADTTSYNGESGSSEDYANGTSPADNPVTNTDPDAGTWNPKAVWFLVLTSDNGIAFSPEGLFYVACMEAAANASKFGTRSHTEGACFHQYTGETQVPN